MIFCWKTVSLLQMLHAQGKDLIIKTHVHICGRGCFCLLSMLATASVHSSMLV